DGVANPVPLSAGLRQKACPPYPVDFPMSTFQTDAEHTLETVAAQGLYRSRRIVASPQGVHLTADGRELVNFCSNDYLGLANHPEVIEAFKKAADRYGVGSGSAHLICGHNEAHHALEEELAEFTGRE